MRASPKSLSGLLPFLRPYRWHLLVAVLFLLLAAAATLAFPSALRRLMDQGFATEATQAQLALNFLQLFGLSVALAVFSAGRYFTVSWLGERITADLRNAVYGHVLQQSPAFFEATQPGEVLSRLSSDTTLVQTVLSSSFSMGLRNLLMGAGALAMLVWTMAGRHRAGQFGNGLTARKVLRDMAEPAARVEFLPVEAGYADGFLTAVLQRMEAKRCNRSRIARAKHAENAAFLAEFVAILVKKRMGRAAKGIGVVHGRSGFCAAAPVPTPSARHVASFGA